MAEKGGNLVSLGVIQAFRLVSGFGVNVLLMRGLGVDGFGIYGYVTTLVGLASFGASLGMDRLLKREIARDPGSAGRHVGVGLVSATLLSLGTGAAIVVWARLADGRPVLVAACALASAALLLQSLAIVPASYFHAIRQMALGVRGEVAGRVVLVVATAGLLWLRLGVAAVFAAQVLDAAVTLVLLWLVYRRVGASPIRPAWGEVTTFVRTSVPFGLNSLFVMVYLSVDVVLLGAMRGDAEVGVYRAAVMLLSLFTVLAETLSTGLFPRMVRYVGQPDRAGEELRFASRVLLALSVPAAVGGVLVAEPFLVLVGGAGFAASAVPFMVMAPLLPLRFLSNGYGMTLSALDRQEDRTRGAFFAAVFNLGANLWVIPRYGVVGAAVTTLATELLLFLWMRWRVGSIVPGLALGGTLVRVAVPSALMAGALVLLPPVHVLVAIALGAGVYAVCGRLTGAWAVADLRRLRSV